MFPCWFKLNTLVCKLIPSVLLMLKVMTDFMLTYTVYVTSDCAILNTSKSISSISQTFLGWENKILLIVYLFFSLKQADFGILFDVDGVLARGSTPLTAALQAIRALEDDDGQLRVPVAFVTNACNRSQDKANQLKKWLNIEVKLSKKMFDTGISDRKWSGVNWY